MESVLDRCKCGDPMNAKGTCGHCDRGWCNEDHVDPFGANPGSACRPKHDPETCPRCIQLNAWEPWDGYSKGLKED